MKITARPSNALTSIRSRLGFTQELMAIQLGISNSLVKLVETNRRSLSTEKLLELARLEITLSELMHWDDQQAIAQSEASDKSKGNHELETINPARHCCNEQLIRLQEKLKKMEFQYSSLTASLYNIDAMAKRNPDSFNPAAALLVQVRARLLKKLVNCGLQAQSVTKKKILLARAK